MGVTSKATHEVEVNTDQAVQGYNKLTAAQKKNLAETKRLSGEGDKQKHTMGGQAAAARNLAKGLMGIAGTAGGIGLLTGALQRMDTHLTGMSSKISSVKNEMIALANVSKETPREDIAMASALGARYGVKSGDAIAAYQQMQARYGTTEGAVLASSEVFDLARLGMPVEQAQQAISFAAEKGLTPEQGSTLAVKASEMSQLPIGKFSEALPALQQYKDAYQGGAAMVALSGAVKPKQLPEFAMQSGRALNMPSKLTEQMEKAAKKQGLDWGGMTALQRVDFIKANVADTTPEGLVNAGLGAKEEARSLSVLIYNRDKMANALGELKAAPADYENQEWDRISAEVPEIRLADEQQRTQARIDHRRMFGPKGPEAQSYTLDRAQRAEGIVGTSKEPFLLNEEGQANALGRTLHSLDWFRLHGGPGPGRYVDQHYDANTGQPLAPGQAPNAFPSPVDLSGVEARLDALIAATNGTTNAVESTASAPSSPSRNGGIE